jgi:hypothetical protein
MAAAEEYVIAHLSASRRDTSVAHEGWDPPILGVTHRDLR